MSGVTVLRASQISLCFAASIALGACAAEAGRDVTSGGPDRGGPPVDGGGSGSGSGSGSGTGTGTTGCRPVAAGRGFVDRAIGQPGEVVVSSEFIATPDGAVDGVIGLSPSGADRLVDLAAAVRLSTDGAGAGGGGAITALDGAAYRADAAMPYTAGQPQRIRIIAVVPTHTFSVYVATGDQSAVQLAYRYAFGTGQAAAWLGSLDAAVDSPIGSFALCNPRSAISVGVRLAREGNYAVAPLVNRDEVVVSDGATTLHLEGNGGVLGQLAAGGQIAADPAGNVYLARITGGNLVVEAYSADLTLRWSRSVAVAAVRAVRAVGADAGSVVAAVGPSAGGVDQVQRWLADGSDGGAPSGARGDAIAIASSGFVIGSAAAGAVTVAKWTFGQAAPDWQRSWQTGGAGGAQGGATLAAIALTNSGEVRFAGALAGPVSFGGDTLQPAPQATTYVAALSATGVHVFSRTLPETEVRGVASNGGVTAISALHAAGARDLIALDGFGDDILSKEGETGFSNDGDAGSVAVGPSGRVYWNFTEAWPTASAPGVPYLISWIPGV